MDLDIEMGDAREGAQEAPFVDLPAADDILPDEPEEPGEVAEDGPATEGASDTSKATVPDKIHIRGLDSLHTSDIKEYVKNHYGQVERVEWIDDTSANLVFSSELIAREAFLALSIVEIADVTALPFGETLPAKPVEGRPEVSLLVRPALESDKKQAGAALRSRYYLLHPEHDPEERRRRQKDDRSHYRQRDGDRRGSERRRRRSDDDIETFDASMYDDAPAPKSNDGLSSHADNNRGKELFTSKRATRNRSASPRRDRDGDDNMDNMKSSAYRNRASARSLKDRILTENTENTGKELFPSKKSDKSRQLDSLEESIGSAHLEEADMPKFVGASTARGSAAAFSIKGAASQAAQDDGFVIKGTAANAKELFPDTLGSSNVGKELLDPSRVKRRQKAHDLFS